MHSVTMSSQWQDVLLFSRHHLLIGVALVSTYSVSLIAGPSDGAVQLRPEMKSTNTTQKRHPLVVAGFVGYGISHFERQADWGGISGFLPAGFQCLVRLSHRLSIGAEFSHSILPFTWDLKLEGKQTAEWSITQTVFTALFKYERHARGTRPHARVGIGLYLGSGRNEFEEGWGRDYDLDYEPGFGGSGGLGITGDWGGGTFYLMEAVYHLAYRRIDEDGAKRQWNNSIAFQIGAGLHL